MTSDDVAAAIIAGGPARRMSGAVKPALDVGGRSIAARQLEVLRAVFGRVLVVANDPRPWAPFGAEVEVVPDRRAGAGPLGGLEAALHAASAAAGSGARARARAAVVCVGGDMPFLSAALLAALRDRAPGADAVAVRVGERVEPLLGRYAVGCLPAVEAQLAAGERAVHRLLGRLNVSWIEEPELRALDPDLRSLINVNTPEDLARAQALAPERP